METGTGISPADIAALTGGGEGANSMWIFALLILLFAGGGFGGFGARNCANGYAAGEVSGYELGLLAGNNATKDNQMSLSNQINTTACNTDATVHAAATNLGNGICSLGYENLRNFTATQQEIANLGRSVDSCCCSTKQMLGDLKYDLATQSAQTRYDMANFAAATNANTTAQVQKVLDALCANRTAEMQNQINQLQLQSALCNVVRYPTPAYLPNYTNAGCGGCSCS